MASNAELFGEDSSSEGEEQDMIIQKKPAEMSVPGNVANDTKKKNDDDNEMDIDDTSEEKKKKEKEKSTGSNSNDDDDDDEGDAEFDDQGAVVGLKSTTLAGGKLNSTSSGAVVDGTNAAAAAEASAASKRSEPPRTLQVQQVDDIIQNTTNLCMHMTKLPNILGIQTEPFDESTYLAAQEEEDFGQAAYNLIRWRYKRSSGGHLVRDDTDDKLQRESNTRLVEWDDGSYSLHVGDEVFQVDSLVNKKFAGLNGYLYLSQTAAYKKKNDDEDDDQPASETVLECMGNIHSRLAVRPSSLQSEAHKSLTVGIRQKTIKKARIAEFVTQEDPEKLKQERIKVKADLEKAALRKKQQSYYYNSRSNPSQQQQRRPRMSREYLEEDDANFDTTNLKDMKRRTMGGDYEEMDDYGDEDDEDSGEDETFHRVRPGKRKKTAEADESDEDEMFFDGGGGDDDDDDEEVAPVVKKAGSAKKKKNQAVLDDDDDSD